MTTMAPEVETVLTDDLNTEDLHGFCQHCYPFLRLGDRENSPDFLEALCDFLEALCGAMVLSASIPTAPPGVSADEIPEVGVCDACLEIHHKGRCPRCGRTP